MHNRSNDFGEVYFALCKSIGSAKALALWLCWKYKSQDLFNLRPDPLQYNDADSFAMDYMAYSYASKFVDADFGIDRKAVALTGFTSSESACLRTNRSIRNNLLAGNTRVANAITRARSIIATVLGDFSWEKVTRHCRWGNGATATLSRKKARVDLKQSGSSLSVSPSAYDYALELICQDENWYDLLTGGVGPVYLQIVDYNRLETVPKSAKTDRLIAAEPTMNGYLQQGVGRYIRKALLRAGVDLSDQGVNQAWAEYAHDLGLATLDLSSASDTIARELVYLLLPLDWALYLDRLRSRCTRLPDGTSVFLHKFSSMGNAATFELETLIFWSLVMACTPQSRQWSVSTYGDDIICHQDDAEHVKEVLSACGFSVNAEKSYVRGRFFESCGKHYFDGIDVTPAYQKTWPERTEPLVRAKRGWESGKGTMYRLAELFRAHNRLAEWALRMGFRSCYDFRADAPVKAIRRQIRDTICDGYEVAFLSPQPTNDDSIVDYFDEIPHLFGRVRYYALRAQTANKECHQIAALQMWWGKANTRNLQSLHPVTDGHRPPVGNRNRADRRYYTSDGTYPWEYLSICTSLHSEERAPRVRRV